MDDDLHRPLGRDRDRDETPWLPHAGSRRLALGMVAGASACVAALFVLAPRGPLDATLGGRPYAIARIEAYRPPPEPVAATSALGSQDASPAASSVQVRSAADHAQAATEVEVQNGVRVVRPGGARGANPLIIAVEPAANARVSAIRQTTPPPARYGQREPARERISTGP